MTDAPIVIAHRGASGYLPEHTLAAKALAYGLGADFLEQDVVATRDGELVVFHDLHLNDVTDVGLRFPGRQRPDGRHYVIDFDLAELRTLRVFERRVAGLAHARFPQRFPGEHGVFQIAGLEDELHLIQGLNRSLRRDVGIYAEIKHPTWHLEQGVDLAAKLVATLRRFGYSKANDLAFVQCFDAAELRRVKHQLGCELRLIQLVSAEPPYQELLTAQGLKAIATYAFGLGPHHSQLVVPGSDGQAALTPMVEFVRDAALHLHPYTFRADELPGYAPTLEHMLEFFFAEVRVHGVFCDHPDIAVRVRNTLRKVQ